MVYMFVAFKVPAIGLERIMRKKIHVDPDRLQKKVIFGLEIFIKFYEISNKLINFFYMLWGTFFL